ncbi:MAG: hypothetical protein ACI9LU_001562, partial [Polaribacter sp.]
QQQSLLRLMLVSVVVSCRYPIKLLVFNLCLLLDRLFGKGIAIDKNLQFDTYF